jgi:hypothetical protein
MYQAKKQKTINNELYLSFNSDKANVESGKK